MKKRMIFFVTCLKPPLLFLSTYFQIFFEPKEIIART
jgi:hypothetical protein